MRREGILLPADARDRSRVFSGPIFSGAFEHEMLKEVRQTRLARGLIRRANFVPDHMRHRGCTMIRDDHEFQSVAEGEVGDFWTAMIGGQRRGC